jgi:hypothetical protein
MVAKGEPAKKMTKSLWSAYEVASENHSLQHYKEMLRDHELLRMEEEQRVLAAEQEKLAKQQEKEQAKEAKEAKAKEAKAAKAAKAKSKAAETEDVEMPDADGEASQKKKAAPKKRKKAEGEENTPKVQHHFASSLRCTF